MNKMNIIDFSDGIRSEEIQENFETLEKQIKRERLSVGGTGIASGLNITPIVNNNQFAIHVSEASIVDNDGEEIFIHSQTINIDKPHLIEQIEYLEVNINNQVTLSEVPYMLDRMSPVQYGNSLLESYTGIEIKYRNSISTNDGIGVKGVQGKVLTLTGISPSKQVSVKYYYTAKRIDVVYIDENYDIKVKSSSITSTTPSVVFPDKFKYLIAFIEIQSNYMKDQSDTPHANILIKKDLRNSRNIYTDNNNTLYLCGVPFTDLHLISTEKPSNPKAGQLWLDLDKPTLYVWKAVDKFVYKRTLEMSSSHNKDTFNDFETNIDYTVNTNTLEIYVNSIKLEDAEWDELYAGTPTNVQIIPKGTTSNQFRIYKELLPGDILTYTITFTESGFRWVPINKESYVNTKECKVYGVDSKWTGNNYWSSPQALALGNDDDGYPYKYSYFIFDAETDKNMLFNPGKNELEIMISQVPLHRDQFSEISLDMIDSLPLPVKTAIKETYGWTEDKINKISEAYDELGIGVKLVNPLDHIYGEGLYDAENQVVNEEELYVEINLNRAVSTENYNRKLQRTATFVYEDSKIVNNTFDKKISIENTFYRYNENQLEVYINGSKLVKNIDYKEGTDLDIKEDEASILKARGSISREFEITKQLHIGDVINYRITTNFYSYDHINSIIDTLELKQSASSEKVEKLYNTTLEFCNNTSKVINDLRRDVEIITGEAIDETDRYLTEDSIINESNIAADLVRRIPQSTAPITHVITFGEYSSAGYDLTEYIREEDFLLIWHRDMANGRIDRMLLPDEDYIIVTDRNSDGSVQVYFRLTDISLSNMNTGDRIIIRGLKFGRDGR